MSKENILKSLVDSKSLTKNQIQLLSNQKTDKDFFQVLVSIFEKKVNDYLSLCQKGTVNYLKSKNVYRTEDIETLAAQEIIDFARSAVLNVNKGSLLFSLITLLKEVQPDLCVSLGMSVNTKFKDETKIYMLALQIEKAFVGYLARYKLAQEVSSNDLLELCTAVQPTSPELFPLYLLRSLLQQENIEKFIVERIANQKTAKNINEVWAAELSQNIKNNSEIFYQCLSGFVFFIGKLIQKTPIKNDVQTLFFNHLADDTKLKSFTDGVCQGYLQAMSSEAQVLKVYMKNEEALNLDSHLRSICLPMLPLLGIKVKFNDNAISERKNDLKKTLDNLEKNKSNFNKSVDEKINSFKTTIDNARKEASSKIEEGFKTALQEANKKIDEQRANFKPNWEISTSAQQFGGTRGPTFNF